MAEELFQKPLTVWRRPEHLMGARIWHRENGFVVRDVTPDFFPFVVEHMTKYFLRDEPMFAALNVSKNPVAVAEMQLMWEHLILTQRISLVALKEGTPGSNLDTVSADNPPEIIGVNQLIINTKEDGPLPDFNAFLQSDDLKKSLGTFLQCGALTDIFERYGVDHYVDGAGMSVASEWRGKGVGQLLVKARKKMCKTLSIPVTKTVFSAIQSQKVGVRGGFEFLGELYYHDLKGPDGLPLFPNMDPGQMKIQLMAMRILPSEGGLQSSSL